MKDEENRKLLKEIIIHGCLGMTTVVDAQIPRIIEVCKQIIKNEEENEC